MGVFKVGDKVFWISQAGGFTKRKEGKIVSVVAPGEEGRRHASHIKANYSAGFLSFEMDGGTVRKHQSYIVMVPNKVKGGKLYWPVASSLVLAANAEIPVTSEAVGQ